MPQLRAITKKTILGIISLTFAVSNFQVYPHGISMDWDSTLAHLPYHEMRGEGIAFLKQHRIPFQEIGSAFPNINTDENVSLNGDFTSFVPIDTLRNNYIFISNVFNDVSKEDRKALQTTWGLVWQRQRGQALRSTLRPGRREMAGGKPDDQAPAQTTARARCVAEPRGRGCYPVVEARARRSNRTRC